MIRYCLFASLLMALQSAAVPSSSLADWIESPLLSRTYAESHALTRAWYTQLSIDSERTKIKHIKLEAGLLLVVTDDGTLHVLDAETGVVNWTTLVGERRLITLGAGANENFVAAVNGDTLYVYDRPTGRVAFRHNTRGTAELGPALTTTRVLLPIVKGPLASFPLDSDPEVDILGPQQLPAAGRMMNEPATFNSTVVWAGDRDRLFGHRFGEEEKVFETYIRFGINSGPVSFPPMVYVGTKAGFLVAYDEVRGERVWEFPAGSPIFHPPVALSDVVYALPQDGGMFAVQPDTGEQLWYAAEPLQFVSASPQLAYTLDYRGRMAMIDAKTGARAAVMPLPERIKPVINQETDRIYLYTDGGLIQCLHEQQLVEPHRYEPPKPEVAPAEGDASPFAPAPAEGAPMSGDAAEPMGAMP